MSATASKPRILVVEDEAIVARDIRLQLAELGYETVGHAARGEQAIALAGELHPDLVLMDVQLAGAMDGIAAAQAIRTQFSLPVVFLTAFAEDETLARAKVTEPFGYILKPFSERELHTVVEMALYKHQADSRLRRSETRFRTMFEAESECVKLVGAGGELLEMNPAGLAMLEAASLEQARAHGLMQFIVPESRTAFLALHQRVMRGGAGTLEFEAVGLRGTRRWLETQATPMRDAGGHVASLLGITRDVTSRKLAQGALRESEARYRLLVDMSPCAIGVHQDGNVVMVNQAALSLFGASRADDLIGWPIEGLIHPDHRAAARDRIERMLAGETGLYPAEEVYLKLDGSVFDVEVSAAPFTYNGRPAVQVIALDISQRKRADAALRDSRRQLQFLSKRVLEVQEAERRRVAHELHDELGQALTAIKINLQGQQRLATPSPADPRSESLRIVDQALQQVRTLALALRPSMLDDLGLAPALKWMAEQSAAQSGFMVRFHTATSAARLEPEIETACFRIVQVALTNVQRHAGAQQVEIDLHQDGATLVLSVSDDGCGFDVAAMLDRASAGASLGLLGMRERAGLIDGQLEIVSAPGQGSTVRLRCPWRVREEPA